MVQLRGDHDEEAFVVVAVLAGELGEHVLAPELLDRAFTKGGDVRIVVETAVAGGPVVSRTTRVRAGISGRRPKSDVDMNISFVRRDHSMKWP